MLEWAYSGVDFSLAGNGGPECAKFLTSTQRVWETCIVIIYAVVCELYYPWRRSICNYQPNLVLRERFGRKLLLAALCLIWGIEIGFKLCTRQLIFLLNPCHVITFFQIILLISPSRKWLHFMFRIQTYAVAVATIALIFPVLNTRHLPFEIASYYIHHVLILVTPFYLMRLGGIYNMEPLRNFHWALLTFGIVRLYHYVVLQPMAIATLVNIDSIMCPAVSDPFNGPWYRIAANIHQSAFIFVHGKLYCFIGAKIFVNAAIDRPALDKHHEVMDKSISPSSRRSIANGGIDPDESNIRTYCNHSCLLCGKTAEQKSMDSSGDSEIIDKED